MTPLTVADVQIYAEEVSLRPGRTGLVGAEAEWLVVHTGRSAEPVDAAYVADLLKDVELPGGSGLSYEPGGQLEISGPPCVGPAACHAAVTADYDAITARLAPSGLRLQGLGIDAVRPACRRVRPSYLYSTQRYFEFRGEAGLAAMCSTASLQVCLDIGVDKEEARRRWKLANALGPMLIAAFANSPAYVGRLTGWKSTRQWIWQDLDPLRCLPAGLGETDPARWWARMLLDSSVLATAGGVTHPGYTLRDWIRGDGALRPPTRRDLEQHALTLFPPVRPRGWLEIRVVDAQDAAYWAVPMAVTTALVDEPDAGADGWLAVQPTRSLWRSAARHGLADDRLARAAARCFEAAIDALPRMGAPALADLVADYAKRYTFQGRSPADDMIDRWV